MAVESIVTGITYEVDKMVEFGFDVLAATRTKAAKKDIAGAMRVIQDHMNRIINYSGNPEDPDYKKLFDHIRKHLGIIKKAASWLKGKRQEEALKYIDDMNQRLEEISP